MNEKNNKRREWVKTAAIIFLSVMLVLTFFSQTILNYSLPEVAAQYISSGTITSKIRGTGVIESGDPYVIEVKETRKVASVAVRVGDTVQKGDVLLYLSEGDSAELDGAKAELEQAEEAYNTLLLSKETSTEIIKEAGNNISADNYRKQITAIQNEIKEAQKKVDEWQKQYDAFTLQISITTQENSDITAELKACNEAKTALDNAQFALTEAENQKAALEAQINYELSVSNGNATVIIVDNLNQQIKQVEKAIISLQTDVNNKQLIFNKANTALQNKQNNSNTNTTLANLNRQRDIIEINLNQAQKVLEEKNKKLTDYISNREQASKLSVAYDELVKARENVAEVEKSSLGSTITADISGTITAINATAGKEISAAMEVVVIQPEGQGYFMSFSVTNEQAKKVSVGDMAELVNAWRYDDVMVTLKSIKIDKNEPSQKKMLTFDINGDVTPGQTLTVSVGQKSSSYDMIVPNSAIREDNNGKFILTVESKSSPLGNRYIATRVDVEVLATDDTQSAIYGGLYGYEYIIKTSTKPVEAGQQVRLAD